MHANKQGLPFSCVSHEGGRSLPHLVNNGTAGAYKQTCAGNETASSNGEGVGGGAASERRQTKVPAFGGVTRERRALLLPSASTSNISRRLALFTHAQFMRCSFGAAASSPGVPGSRPCIADERGPAQTVCGLLTP